jgi:hypothetical protein
VIDTFKPRLDILPAAQRQLWAELRPVQQHGYVLYGGTAIALRLGHRQSVDFDFFSAQPVDAQRLRAALPFVKAATVRQESANTFEVETATGVKVAFFGGLEFGRVGRPQRTADGVMRVASLDDLMATKVKVILQRSESKDYRDIAAMVRAGVSLETGLAAAEKMFRPTFPTSESLKALVYFEGGDMARLSAEDRAVLTRAAARVKSLPAVTIASELAPAETEAQAPSVAPSVRTKIVPPRQGPRMGF